MSDGTAVHLSDCKTFCQKAHYKGVLDVLSEVKCYVPFALLPNCALVEV